MKALRWMLCGALVLGCAQRAWAQDPPADTPEPNVSNEFDDDAELPPVTVRGESDAATVESNVSEASPFDLPFSYPSLSEVDLEGLDGATRSGVSLFDYPSLATIVGREDLEEKQAADMFQALQYEVGILMQQTANGQASPFIRGLTGQKILVLIDGIRMNNSTYRAGPNQYFNTVDPGQVERIEVIRGAQSMLWGSDAIGGVINIVTRSASLRRGEYTGASFTEYFSSADTASYSRTNVEGSISSGGFFGGGSYMNVNDLDRGGNLGRQPFTSYSQYAGDFKYNYLLGPDQMLTVALQHFEQQDLPRSDRFPPFVFGPPSGTPRPTFFDPQQRDLTYLRWEGLAYGPLFDAFSVTASYGRQREAVTELRSPTRTDIGEFDVNTLGASLVLARELGWAGRLVYGADWNYDDVDAYRDRLNPSTGTVTPAAPQFPDDSWYQRAGAYVSWEVDVFDRLSAFTGARFEHAEAAGSPEINGQETFFKRHYQDWIGSVGLVYEIDPMLHLVGTVSEGFRAPNLDDLTADNTVLQNSQDIPSLNVRPEQSITYEVGFKVDTPRLRLQVFEYWIDLGDNILREPVGGGDNIRANFDSYINGTELTAEYLLGDGWSTYGNFAYTYGRDLVRGEPLSRIPPTQGVVGLRWRDECRRTYCDLFTWLVRRQDRYAAQDMTDARFPVGGTPGFGTLNLRMGTRLGRCENHRLSFTLENITDKAYRVLGSGVDGPGFNFIAGYEWVH